VRGEQGRARERKGKKRKGKRRKEERDGRNVPPVLNSQFKHCALLRITIDRPWRNFRVQSSEHSLREK